MGRHGPLTSIALGRSPYDEVIQGEGEGDIRAPLQMYDEKGRPINPDTKRINKDVIRSHNEIMLVVGVAEPENGLSDSQIESKRRHQQYEDNAGRRLRVTAELVETAVVWGVNGLRQRVLIYKRYSNIPFHRLFRYHFSQQSVGSYFLSGLPTRLTHALLRHYASRYPTVWSVPGIRHSVLYLVQHLKIWIFFQRMGLISSTYKLPNWRFFIPGTALSPIPIPSIPTSLSARGIFTWLGQFAVGLLPIISTFVVDRWTLLLRYRISRELYMVLPRPFNAKKTKAREICPDCGEAHDAAGTTWNPLSGDGHETTRAEPARPSQTQQSQHHTAPEPATPGPSRPPPPPAVPPARSDDFGSDDEETELVGGTLISFDVEATEPTDTPPGWCAELRPNVAEGSQSAPHEPVFRENALTLLPAYMAGELFAILPTRLVLETLEGMAWSALARQILRRQGLPTDGIRGWGTALFAGLWTSLGLNILHVMVQSESWAMLYMMATGKMKTSEEWEEMEAKTSGLQQ